LKKKLAKKTTNSASRMVDANTISSRRYLCRIRLYCQQSAWPYTSTKTIHKNIFSRKLAEKNNIQPGPEKKKRYFYFKNSVCMVTVSAIIISLGNQ